MPELWKQEKTYVLCAWATKTQENACNTMPELRKHKKTYVIRCLSYENMRKHVFYVPELRKHEKTRVIRCLSYPAQPAQASHPAQPASQRSPAQPASSASRGQPTPRKYKKTCAIRRLGFENLRKMNTFAHLLKTYSQSGSLWVFTKRVKNIRKTNKN